MRIALVGTRGVPARYGGFETCVEEVGRRLVERGHEVVVYCRGDAEVGDSYLGMRLVHLPALRKRSLETLSHSALSVLHLVSRRRPDAVVVFNAANSPFLPVLRARRVPVATHVDGLEWRRGKWGPTGRRYYRAAEALAVRWSDALIADAQGIADYYRDEFDAGTDLIAYGAPTIDPERLDRLGELDLTPRGYHLVVARFEPENHLDLVVEGYVRSDARLPLVVVGSAPYSDAYTERVTSLADDRVRLLGGIWDQELLDQLYAGSLTYLHGHSVGGTNPSLLRAIGAQAPVSAFDVVFNREVLGEAGHYFGTPEDVRALVTKAEADPQAERERGVASGERAARYDWDDVTAAYEQLCARLAASGPLRHRASGRRRAATSQADRVGAER
ncbi:DUF1972 domain-containing protein [Angustibacter luteus]|uniref:DUF1972 domain-containing protein n=1 Tax=Angustibacter luteus TaxID=658456 RepID=A0ABW1JCC1_9ACTN